MGHTIDMSRVAREIKRDLRGPLVEAGALIVVDEIVTGIQTSVPAGREYYVPGTRTKYTASAPGQPPADRTGRYVGSWHATPAIEDPEGASAFAVSELTTRDGRWFLGDLLENGTIHMEPRPHIAPAIPRAAERIEREILSQL